MAEWITIAFVRCMFTFQVQKSFPHKETRYILQDMGQRLADLKFKKTKKERTSNSSTPSSITGTPRSRTSSIMQDPNLSQSSMDDSLTEVSLKVLSSFLISAIDLFNIV